MPHAVTHFLIPLILLGLFQDIFIKNKKYFPIHYVFIGGLAGLLPDFDIAVYYIASFFGFTIEEIHRTFSHTLFVPLLFIILGFVFWNINTKFLKKHKMKLRVVFFVIAFGTFMHIFLDSLISGVVMPLYPISYQVVGLNLISFLPPKWQESAIPTIDAILLILWVVYLEVKHKISDVI